MFRSPVFKSVFKSPALFQKFVFISIALLMTFMAQTSSAQNKYNTWSDPNAPAAATSQKNATSLQKMVNDLNNLINEADRDRAAAPAFIRDLRDLSRRYDVPWRVSLVNETFSDGNFNVNPTWRVTSGRWWVEKNFGLRAAFETTHTQSTTRQQNNDDMGKQLLGAILNQALGGNQKKSTTRSTSSSTAPAAIHLDQTISNAFSTQIEFTSWNDKGSFEIAVYQNTRQSKERKMGYRLFYRAGQSTALELVRVSRYGTNAIQTYTQSLKLEDKRTHVLVWNRDRVGNMSVAIDGKKLMSVRDQSFNDPFNGLSLINNGGDYIISKVAIKGTH